MVAGAPSPPSEGGHSTCGPNGTSWWSGLNVCATGTGTGTFVNWLWSSGISIGAVLGSWRSGSSSGSLLSGAETSTGVGHDIAAFGKLVAATPALLLVDAISGLGAMECRTDEWHIDLCATGSQKALMLPPGLAFLAVSDKAWKQIDKNASPRTFYFDLKKTRKSLETSDTPYTMAHTLVRALRVSLKRILAEGIENVWARHARNAAAARAGFQAMGLELFASQPAAGLTPRSL